MTCPNEINESYVSERDFEKTLYKHATMISDNLDLLSPEYTLISFLSIANAYFSLMLLLFSTFYSLFTNTT